MRCRSSLLLVLVLFVACQRAESPGEGRAGGEPTSDAAVIGELPSDCDDWHGRPSEPEITFIKGERLFAIGSAKDQVRCIGEADDVELSWGARGDRLLLSLKAFGDGFRNRLPGDQRQETWSRPTGTSVIYISHDFRHLIKEDVVTGGTTDISFLEEHFDVSYHPSGTHIAVSGTDSSGQVGLYLATNLGTDVQQIVRGEHAEHIEELSFSGDGRLLYFRADHGDHFDLHAARIVIGTDEASEMRSSALMTVSSSTKAASVVASPFRGKRRLLYTSGCSPESEALVRVGDRKYRLDPGLGGIKPVGWLPDRSVAFLSFGESRCDEFGRGDLYLWEPGSTTLLVKDVRGAAIRAVLPDPPDPPAETQGVVA